MRISGIPLRVCSREDSVDQNEGSNDLCTQSNTFAVTITQLIGPTTIPVVVSLLEGLNQPNSTYGPQTLSHHVHYSPYQRHLPSQEQSKSHCWVYVTPYIQFKITVLRIIINKNLLPNHA